MSSLQDYKNRVSGSIRTSLIDNTIRKYADSFRYSPSYYQVELNGSPIDAQIVDDSNTKDQKVLSVLFETPISCGDIITWKSSNWLVIHYDEMSEIYKRTRIQKCIGKLRWLDEDGDVCDADFIFPSPTASNFGIEYGRYIDSGNERRQLVIPKTIDSLKLEKGKRFIVDGRAWELSAVDRLNNGLVNLTLTEGEIESADNLELEIADYEGNVANFSITILNGENFSIKAGQTLQLHAEVRNNDELVNKDIVYESSNPSIASISPSGLLSAIGNGTVVITAKISDKPNIIDTTSVTIQLETTHNYSIELNDTPTIILGNSKTYTAVIKDNLVVDPSRIVYWYLYAADGVSVSDVAQMTFNSSTQCTLKGIKIGKCKLKAILIGSFPTIEQVFDIQVKSLI